MVYHLSNAQRTILLIMNLFIWKFLLQSVRRRSETSLDSCHRMPLSPGEDRNFIAVGRNLKQWYSFIHHGGDEEFAAEQSSTPPKGKT